MAISINNNDTLRTRIKLVAFVVVLVFLLLGARGYHVQINRHDELYGKARRLYTSERKDAPKRGEILDRNGNLLVGNIPCFELIADPSIVGEAPECLRIATLIELELGIPSQVVYQKLMRKSREVVDPESGAKSTRPLKYVMLAREITLESHRKLEDAFKVNKLGTGLFFTETYMRHHPKGKLLSNILGLTTVDRDRLVPLAGIERLLDAEMSGSTGRRRYERDIGGRPIYYGEQQELAVRRDGRNVYLTIDEPIQTIVEEELDLLMERVQPESAYAVLLDPKTGNVLAMAQRPSFDPNNRRIMSDLGGRLRLIEDVFEPGSIMKPLTVAGALDRGVVSPETTFFCENGRWAEMRNLTDTHRYGDLTVEQIIQKSSNIGTAKIALAMGKEMLDGVLRSFGLGSRTGIPLRPETRGIYPASSQWGQVGMSRFGIGYGVAASPLQMARAYCALADHGNLRPVRLIDRTVDPESGEIYVFPYEQPVKLFRRPETAPEILRMMQTVTRQGGTALQAGIPGYYVAGKTGTARKSINGSYSNKHFASFAGIVPADDPAFVLLITVDSPTKGGYYGGPIAGPTFRAIGERVLRHMDIKPHPDLAEEYAREEARRERNRR